MTGSPLGLLHCYALPYFYFSFFFFLLSSFFRAIILLNTFHKYISAFFWPSVVKWRTVAQSYTHVDISLMLTSAWFMPLIS